MQTLEFGTLLARDTLLAGDNMDLRPGTDGSGLVAFLIVAGLVVVCVVLYRSMRVQLRNIDVDRFNQPDPMSGPASEPPDAGPDQRPTRGSAGSEPT